MTEVSQPRSTSTRKVRLIADGFVFPEAPTWFEDRLWVSDVVAGGVFEVGHDGRHSTRHLPDRRGIGGMAVTEQGRLIASGRDLVDALSGETWLPRPDGSRGLNDLGTTRTGDLLVGVLNYRPLAGDEAVAGSIGRIMSGTVKWSWAAGVTWPNGIAALSDGTIVVADFAVGTLGVLDDDAGGGVTNQFRARVIARSPSGHFDGLCVDDADHIWVATGPGGSVVRLDRDGLLVDRVDLPADFTSSVCFSGDDPHRLLVTVSGCSIAPGCGGAVLAFEVETPGGLPAAVRVSSM